MVKLYLTDYVREGTKVDLIISVEDGLQERDRISSHCMVRDPIWCLGDWRLVLVLV